MAENKIVIRAKRVYKKEPTDLNQHDTQQQQDKRINSTYALIRLAIIVLLLSVFTISFALCTPKSYNKNHSSADVKLP